MKRQSVLITGGAGFIGSHVADVFAQTHHVTVYDNGQSAVTDFSHNSSITYIKGDIRDYAALKKAMVDQDLVIAMAAAHIRLSFTQPQAVHDINGTGNFITLLAARDIKLKKIMYISSSEVYGTAQYPLMDEQHPINPTTIYGASKYIGEIYTQEFGAHEGLATTIIRPFNTYGPRSHFDGYYGEVIPRMVIRALNKLPPIIFGTGEQTRDFTFVTDTAAGIKRIAMDPNSNGKTYNVACGREISINEVAKTIVQLTDCPPPEYRAARPNDVMRHAADVTKVRTELSFNAQTSLHDGIKQYIQWVKTTYPNRKILLSKIPEQNW